MTGKTGPTITCSDCGHTWTRAVSTLAPGDTLSFAFDPEIACPSCGAIDRSIRTGDTFSVTEDGSLRKLVSALRPASATGADYRELVQVLEDAVATGATREETAEAVADRSSFAALAAWIKAHPDTRTVTILSLIATVVGIVLANTQQEPEPAPPPVVNVHVHYDEPSVETVRRLVEDELRRREADDERRSAPARPDAPRHPEEPR
ncbi:hypothetical protein [Actinomycetospora flava]|uniref:Uncharacterized protein n=1 Tax=Actinomycetospora flava TaxID=3129232 RepID=A0ABU8LZN2_9PSEU